MERTIVETLLPIDEKTWYEDIGLRIKLARQEMRLTQQELAEKTGLKRTSITNIEKGLQKTSVYMLYKLSYILNKDFHDLLPNVQTVSVVDIAGKKMTVTPKSEDLIRDLLKG